MMAVESTMLEKVPLKAADLRSKDDPKIALLFNYSFQYLVAGIMDEISLFKGYKDTITFNESNTITAPLLRAYPFFVAVSNGHGKSLYSLFGDFEASPYGPSSKSIEELLVSTKGKFKYFTVKNTNIEVNNPSSFSSFEKIKRAIENEGLSDFAEMGMAVPFKNIAIEKDENPGDNFTPLFETINNGIGIINRQSNRTFFDGELLTIMFQSTYFDVFNDKLGKGGENTHLEYNEIDDPRRRPFYQP